MEAKKYKEDFDLIQNVKKGNKDALDTLYNKLNRIIMENAFVICKKTCETMPHNAGYCPEKKALSSCEDFNDARSHVFNFLLNMQKQTGPLFNYRAIASLNTYSTMVLEKYKPYLVMNWYRKKTRRYPYSSHYPAVIKKMSSEHQEVFSLMTVGKGKEYIASFMSRNLNIATPKAAQLTEEWINDIKHALARSEHMNKIMTSEVQMNENITAADNGDPEKHYLTKETFEKLSLKHHHIREACEKLTPLERLVIRLMADKDWTGKEIAAQINKSSAKKQIVPLKGEKVKEQDVYKIISKGLRSITQHIKSKNPDFFKEDENMPEWLTPEGERERMKYIREFLVFYGMKPPGGNHETG